MYLLKIDLDIENKLKNVTTDDLQKMSHYEHR